MGHLFLVFKEMYINNTVQEQGMKKTRKEENGFKDKWILLSCAIICTPEREGRFHLSKSNYMDELKGPTLDLMIV